MRGLWRPMAVYGVASVAVTSVFFLGQGPLSPWQGALFGLGLVPVPLVLATRAVLPTSRFLRGLREGGLAYVLVEDRVGWLGGRRLTLRTLDGVWTILTRNAGGMHLHVRGPHMPRHHQVRGEWRKAGILAARLGREAAARRHVAAPGRGGATGATGAAGATGAV